jgi:outer membrane putative beta-barrel porin/alpha-amylase
VIPRRGFCLVLGALAVGLAGSAGAAPLRTHSPGTGVYRGFALDGWLAVGDERGGGVDLRETVAGATLRYTPATSWSFALTVPRVERRARVAGVGERSLAGLGDLTVTGKYRFYRRLGRWGDRQAALEAGLKLPTGESRTAVDPRFPLSLRRALQPGSGSTDGFVDLSYQQAHGRFVQAADAGYRQNGADAGYRFGAEAHLNLDAEAIALPRTYEVPGNELFTLLEATLVRREADTYRGVPLAGTRRTELLLVPGLEYVATEQLSLGLSLALPVVSDVDREGRKSRFNVRVEARYAF